MSMPRLALILALGAAACTEHAPSFGRLTLSDGGTTEPLTGDSSGGSVPTTSAGDGATGDMSSGDTSSSEPVTTGETTGPAPDTTSGDTTAAPVNEPPTVARALAPESVDAAGVVQLAIEVSADVVEVDIVYRGEVVATLPPAAFPFDFEVTSQARCNGDEAIRVIAHDAEGLTGDDATLLTCSLPVSGSEAHKAQLPGTTLSMVHSVAILGDDFVAVGVLDGQIAVWRVGPDLQVLPGWPRVLADWTGTPGLAALDSAAVGVAVDADQNIIVAGNTVKAGVKTYYVVKLNAAGSRIAPEVQGLANEEAAGVAVTPAGLIVVAGAVRTAVQPPAFDWRVWGYAKLGAVAPWVDTLPLGPGEILDEFNMRSERARAVVVLPGGELLVVGEREYKKIDEGETYIRASWQRYNDVGVRVGDLWTSDANGPGNTSHDAANAVIVLSDDEFVISGWARAKLGQPPQVWSRRFPQGEAKDFRVEQGLTAEAKGIGHDRENNLVVATTATSSGQVDAWAFAFHGWALPAVWSQPPYGDPQGWDGYTSIACTTWGYCVTGGFLTVNGMITGFLRLHNP